MSRQVLHRDAKLEELANARMLQIKSRIAKLPLQRVAGVLVFPRTHQSSQAGERLLIEAQHLAHLTRSRTAAVGDHIGRHGRTQLAVALIHVLNCPLALIPAGKVEIDVGPLAALFREEALEQQLHSNGIDRRDSQRIADGAVGSRAASLHQDALLAAEADDVPDDQEVSFEFEPLDECSSRSICRRARCHSSLCPGR